MKLMRLLLIVVFVFVLGSCGGGGSSSDSSTEEASSVVDGSGTGSDAGEVDSNSDSAGTSDLSGSYIGTQNLVLSLGGVSEVADIEAIVTVTGNAILIDPLTANGSIAANTFVATTNRTSTQGGLTCQFLLTYQGDISFVSLSGNISGTAICDQGEGNQTLDVTGTISANRS